MLALSPEAPPRLEELLFGDLLGISTADLLAAGGLALATGAALAVAHRPLALTSFDREASPSLGATVARWETALLVLLGVGTVAAAPGLGSLLLVALIIAPAAAALRVTRRLPPALAIAAGRGRRSRASRASRSPTTPGSPRARASRCVPWLRQFSLGLQLKS